MNRLHFLPQEGDDLVIVERESMHDARGGFSRFYCTKEFSEAQIEEDFVQMNLSQTKRKGTIRGMHFQRPPRSEKKVVTCIRGEIFDVAIDLRRESVDYLKVSSFLLSEVNKKSLIIPQGFAHGFQTLCDDCEVFYMHSDYFSPSHEDGLNPFDGTLRIDWPLECAEISDRDRKYPYIDDTGFKGVLL